MSVDVEALQIVPRARLVREEQSVLHQHIALCSIPVSRPRFSHTSPQHSKRTCTKSTEGTGVG